jgi:hypothetical protein
MLKGGGEHIAVQIRYFMESLFGDLGKKRGV